MPPFRFHLVYSVLQAYDKEKTISIEIYKQYKIYLIKYIRTFLYDIPVYLVFGRR